MDSDVCLSTLAARGSRHRGSGGPLVWRRAQTEVLLSVVLSLTTLQPDGVVKCSSRLPLLFGRVFKPKEATTMRVFSDGWVIDRTLFDHAALGQRECCGGGIAMMAQSALLLELCTDLDTDDRRQDALAPFPPCIKAEIDRDRLTIRQRLKETLPRYQAIAASSAERSFADWWASMPLARKQSICVMPVAEVPVVYGTQLDVRGAYSTLLAALLEQVRRFPETGCGADGVIEPEGAFEEALTVKRGAFVLTPEYLESATLFVDLLGSVVGGPKLLPARAKQGGSGESTAICIGSTETSGFRGDRRLIRLCVARYMVDRAIREFEKEEARPSAAALAATDVHAQV